VVAHLSFASDHFASLAEVKSFLSQSQEAFDRCYEEVEVQVLRDSRIVVSTCTTASKLKLKLFSQIEELLSHSGKKNLKLVRFCWKSGIAEGPHIHIHMGMGYNSVRSSKRPWVSNLMSHH